MAVIFLRALARAGASPAPTLYDIRCDADPYRVGAGLAPALANWYTYLKKKTVCM